MFYFFVLHLNLISNQYCKKEPQRTYVSFFWNETRPKISMNRFLVGFSKPKSTMYVLMTKFVQSRWLDIGRVLFLHVAWTETESKSINMQKKNKANTPNSKMATILVVFCVPSN